ncbi:MAG: hypothetical protein JST66_15265 [Bacteroidetes bacterium]|nr:hypothetical protein [Bacteroidota bacterium]
MRKMNRSWALFGLGMLSGTFVLGQNEEDALRYSQTLPGGTARSWAMGSAFGAVGADPASASLNPAGFGLYNTSEISFTPGFEVNDAKAKHYGTSATGNDNRFSFNNLSLMLSYPGSSGSDWRGGVFGVSFDRQASFHWEQRAVGDNVNSTILQRFVNEANGTAPGDLADAFPFTSDLAYQTYALNPTGDTIANTYDSAIPFGSDVRQEHTISTSGRLNTTSLFYAANYMDRLYIGGSLGIVGVRYDRRTTHRETTLDETLDLKDLSYQENLRTTGSGIDLKVGVIGRATDNLRLGLAFHSPMWLQMNDAYTYSMNTGFRTPDANGKTGYSWDSPDGAYAYRVRTPWRVVASAAYVAGKHGLVSVDYGYTNFRQSKLNSGVNAADDYDFSMENDVIHQDLRSTHSVRVGTEWRSGPWYFRGGWGYWPDAYADNDARQGTAYMRYTAGFGFRSEHVSVDLAGIYGTRDIKYFQYDPALVAATSERLTDTHGLLTIAFRP